MKRHTVSERKQIVRLSSIVLYMVQLEYKQVQCHTLPVRTQYNNTVTYHLSHLVYKNNTYKYIDRKHNNKKALSHCLFLCLFS